MTRVLIVDDHAFIRRGVHSILLASPGWEPCGEAENGRDAVRLAGELKPEAVVMDISMPEMNGIEAARTIHQLYPEMKIVLLTLHNSTELVKSAFRAGAQGYLLKADAERELVRALTVVLGDGTYVSPKIDSDMVKNVFTELHSP